MKVMKFGGSSLKDADGFQTASNIIKNEKDKKVVILSGVYGVTDTIRKFIDSGNNDEETVKEFVQHLYNLHIKISLEAIEDKGISIRVHNALVKKLERLERLLRGVYYVEELTDKTRDLILSYGERLSVTILEGTLNDINVKSRAFEADGIGVLTNGDFGNATAILNSVADNLKKNISPSINKNIVPIITGFFGCDSNGHTTSFGRNGSDYSASVIAYAIDADYVELWKDVNGFMSADPSFVKDAHL
ncbi:hypothetical protein KAR91_43230, partial [Candidatus Pacearchaeota archaeon]|nr:hypothetical protein [Candidatus Pacearchaeota archaeon]